MSKKDKKKKKSFFSRAKKITDRNPLDMTKSQKTVERQIQKEDTIQVVINPEETYCIHHGHIGKAVFVVGGKIPAEEKGFHRIYCLKCFCGFLDKHVETIETERKRIEKFITV